MEFRLDLINTITSNFSEDQKVGSGAYGVVYRAVHNGEAIAVKRLYSSPGFDDRPFDNEFHNLTKVCHQNVVQLLGYCYESRNVFVKHMEELIYARVMERVLCFEYVQGGSLDKYIADGSCTLDWPTCYKIIQGTCEGLNYLHNAQEDPIFHLDLKPAKILLDKKMMPKISGFGLSRLLAAEHTHNTINIEGARGYSPPEYVDRGIISKKFDVFSLGLIIIEIMAGNMGYSQLCEMSESQFIEFVCKNWMEKLHTMSGHSSHQIHIFRVRTCLGIALRCIDADRNKRPTIQEIILALEEKLAGVKAIISPSLAESVSGTQVYVHKSKRVGETHSSTGFTFNLIDTITNNFSADQKIRSSGYSDLYKAVHNGEEIAVQKLHPKQELDDEAFYNGLLCNLTKVSHQNVVRLLGYCYEPRRVCVKHMGGLFTKIQRERVLCFEYVQGGSLDKYIEDGSCRLDWPTCYDIIKGTCEGLNHLHNAQEAPIFHLNLKPSQILLDKSMTPKIAGLGLSKLLASSHTHNTINIEGARGYTPPEYLDRGIISKKFDVYSLGVIIIEIMAGNMGFSQCSVMFPRQFIELVCKNWMEKLHTMSGHSSHEIDNLRVRTCLVIALRCVNADRKRRPTIHEVILALEQNEAGVKAIMSSSPDHKSNRKGREDHGLLNFTLALIETITYNFSEDKKIGSGGYADVYKAVHNGEEIAVKRFHQMQRHDNEKAFTNEICNLIKVRHNNVIQLIGYCHETRRQILEFDGEIALEQVTERILCFEYMHGGNLDRYIADESCALDWPTCYNIIEGTCKGLYHLHNSQENPIFHLHLNPANILLDKSMTPKIAALGSSRLVASTITEITDNDAKISWRQHAPPEYLTRAIISKKFDVFSLGIIIIKMMSGNIGLYSAFEMCPNKFIEHVCTNWKEKLQTMSSHETDILRVHTCINLALSCLDDNRNRRPSIEEIMCVLEIKKIVSVPPDHKSIWSGVDYESHSTTAPDRSKDLTETDIKSDLEAEFKTKLSLSPDSKDLTEAEIKTNLIWSGPESQPGSMTSLDQSNDLLCQMRSEPHLLLQYLKDITKNFSSEREIGRGGFSVIYKGVLQNGEMVAVKKLLDTPSSQMQFENEVNILMKLKHPNIVRLVGYCYETKHLRAPEGEKFVFAEKTESLLCLEFISDGSLDKYISDASIGLDWRKRCIIIKGISLGLQYLHEQKNDLVIHLDLKPANILLGKNMVPKITDFGLSKLFDEKQTSCSGNTYGTRGYMPPEHVQGITTPKWDIFSLGVIIMEVITGHRDYPYDIRKASTTFIKEELEKWKKRMQEQPGHTSLETDCQQIERYIQIGLICVNSERIKRPTIKQVIDMLQGLESMDFYIINELSDHDAEP